ncbi:MAG: hypothetical protein PHR20_00785 [Bacteroidales bacterium]|nr:hypothetical protein [Bacteroidales bacterium]
MEQWIILILGLIWVVATAIGKARKQAEKTVAAPEKKELFNKEGEFFNKKEQENRQKTENKSFSTFKKEPQKEGNFLKKSENLKKISEEASEEHSKNQDVEGEADFDLKKAVIFSEILHTPYINNCKN